GADDFGAGLQLVEHLLPDLLLVVRRRVGGSGRDAADRHREDSEHCSDCRLHFLLLLNLAPSSAIAPANFATSASISLFARVTWVSCVVFRSCSLRSMSCFADFSVAIAAVISASVRFSLAFASNCSRMVCASLTCALIFSSKAFAPDACVLFVAMLMA